MSVALLAPIAGALAFVIHKRSVGNAYAKERILTEEQGQRMVMSTGAGRKDGCGDDCEAVDRGADDDVDHDGQPVGHEV